MGVTLFESKKNCCGCWACYNVCPKSAISMKDDIEGFKYPVIDNDICIECGLCQKVCPIKIATERKSINDSKPHIGIINLQFVQNYGAVIAAAVLEDIVKKIVGESYVVETINYGPSLTNGTRLQLRKDAVQNVGGWREYLKRRLVKGYKSDYNSQGRTAKFKIFRDTFLNITKFYTDCKQIIGNKNYKAFIVGSDVVWHKKRVQDYRADGYFLKFAQNQKCISYAASIDSVVDKDLIKLEKYYKEGLSHIDCISIREKSNVEFLKGLTEKTVFECCDPAFLYSAEQYDKMMELADYEIRNPSEKYIYVYALDENIEPLKYAERLAKEKNFKILYYSETPYEFSVENEKCIDDGPAEFLCRLKNAEYVLTTSFHCVVFSLLFCKQFLSFSRSKTSNKSIDLLEKFCLSERIVSDTNNENIDNVINFNDVKNTITYMRNESLDYLMNALSDV